jgi:hypothetical protein
VIAADTIWIVERQRDEDYGAAKHVISWHPSLAEAENEVARLQGEFDRARELVTPMHLEAEAIFEMLQEHEHAKYMWIDCSRDECEAFDRDHTHLTEREFEEHEAAFVEQLKEWWWKERNAWQDFVESEVMSKMSDPPALFRHLSDDEEVRYVCYAVGRRPRAVPSDNDYCTCGSARINHDGKNGEGPCKMARCSCVAFELRGAPP